MNCEESCFSPWYNITSLRNALSTAITQKEMELHSFHLLRQASEAWKFFNISNSLTCQITLIAIYWYVSALLPYMLESIQYINQNQSLCVVQH